MTMPTDSTLTEATIKKLQNLIQANIDSVNGFREAADEVSDESIASLFRSLATERSNLASDLQKFVDYNGESPKEEGSLAAKVHRTWIDLRSKLSGGDPYAVLAEAERGEDHIKHAYEEALKETAGSPLNDVLLGQYKTVKAGHDQVRDLRDAFKQQK